MIIRHHIGRSIEGTIDEVIAYEGPALPSLDEVRAVIRALAFLAEVTPALQTSKSAQAVVRDADRILAALEG